MVSDWWTDDDDDDELIEWLVQAVYISRVNEDGPAAVDGKLAVGDRIVSVSFNLLFILIR